MSERNTPSLLPERDYDAIESAVMETERGRWFLAEYTRRNRSADTEMLLSAIKKLESALTERQAIPHRAPSDDEPETDTDQLRFDLMEMAATIAQTKLDIAAISPKSGKDGHITTVTSELSSIVTATETATYDILQGAEGVQEIIWALRDSGFDPKVCANLEAHVTEVFAACEFQDLTGQRIVKVVQVLEYIEERLNSMINIWGDEALIEKTSMSPDLSISDSPLQPAVAISQVDVDELMWADPDSLPDNTGKVDLGPLDIGDDEEDVVFDHSDEAAAEEILEVAAAPEELRPQEEAADEFEDPNRKTLVELSQDVRTILFS